MVLKEIYHLLTAFAILATVSGLIPDYCGPPKCNTEQDIATLQIAENRNYFYQCTRNAEENYEPVLLPCGAGTVFGFYQQHCVFESEWEDLCANGGTTTTSLPITTTTDELNESTTSLPITTTTDEGNESTTSLPITTTTDEGNESTTSVSMTTTTDEGGESTTSLPITTTTDETNETTTSLPITTTTNETNETTTSLTITTTTDEGNETTTTLPITTTTAEGNESTTSLPITTTTDEGNESTTLLPITTTTDEGNESTTLLPITTTTDEGTETTTSLPITTTTDDVDTTTLLPITTTTQEFTTTADPPTTTVGPPLNMCSRPLCNTALERILRHPSEIPNSFYICNRTPDDTYEPVIMYCDFGTNFSFENQYCVPPDQWVSACDRSMAPACQPIRCSMTLFFTILMPAEDREHYYECTTVGMEQELRTCEPGTWFGYRQQACVQPEEWIDECGPSA